MRIDVDENRNIRLREVYNGILLETSEGNQLGICMRDDTFEINIMPKGIDTKNWQRINMQTGKVEIPQVIKEEANENSNNNSIK